MKDKLSSTKVSFWESYVKILIADANGTITDTTNDFISNDDWTLKNIENALDETSLIDYREIIVVVDYDRKGKIYKYSKKDDIWFEYAETMGMC